MADKLHSKTAFVAELVPTGRKLVELSIELANTPGTLAEVASVLSKHKINVLTGFHDAEQWSFFADITEIESSVDEMVKEISSLPHVSKVSLAEGPSEGIIVDTLHQQQVWGPFRTITVRAEVMSSILDRLKGIFGAEGSAGRAILFGMGEAGGRTAYRVVADQIGDEVARSHVKNLVGLLTSAGWGEFNLVNLDFDRITARVDVFNCFECDRPKGVASPAHPIPCDFVRGNLAGLFSEMLGKRVDVTETSCVSRGHSHCQFEVQEAKQ